MFIGHRSLVSIQLCLVLPPLSSSSCTCILLSPFLSHDLFSGCSFISFLFCRLVLSITMLVWQYNHHFLSQCVLPSSIFFSWSRVAKSQVVIKPVVQHLPKLQCVFLGTRAGAAHSYCLVVYLLVLFLSLF